VAFPISNINILVDTWESLILRHNALSRLMSADVITANASIANTGNATTSKIAQLWGAFGANTVAVTTSLRGGNVSSNATLPITSNVDIFVTTGAAPILRVGNNTLFSTVNGSGAAFSNGTTNTTISSETVSVKSASGNATVNSSIITIVSGASTANLNAVGFSAGIVVANQTQVSVGANVLANATHIVSGIVVANQTQVSVGANVFANATHLQIGNSTVNAVMNSSSLGVVGSVSAITLNASGNATVSGSANVTGNINGSANITSNGNLILKTDLVVDVSANSNIGAGTGTNILLYRFDKTLYSSAEFTVQVKNGSNTQISKIMLAQNNSSAELTVYGTVSSPQSANSSPLLASFTANLNSANVELFISQTQASSGVKLVAQLIK